MKANKWENFLELAKSRKTTYEFSDEKVSDEILFYCLESARFAPSCVNTQPWHFIVVKDKKKIAKMMETANYGVFHQYPSLIIACVLINERCAGENFACFRGVASHVHDTYMSVGIAAEHICLAARDIGIGSCIVTPKQKDIKNILDVKKEDAVPLLVGLGYEKKEVWKKPKERLELKKIMSYETFGGKK